MGTPGYYVLCPKGHIIGLIEEHLYWGSPEDYSDDYFNDESESNIWKRLENYKNKKCDICKNIAKYTFCHYGDINDCIHSDFKLKWNNKEKRYIIPKKLSENQRKELNDYAINHNDKMK